MKVFTPNETTALVAHTEYPSVSIFLPTHVPGDDVREDAIRLKNLLNACQINLLEELPHKQVDELLKSGFDLLAANSFRQEPNRGLGLFMSGSLSEHFYLDRAPDEGLHIGRYFHVLPLLGSLEDRSYYLLILSQNEVRLLQVDGNHAHEVPLGDVPKTIDEFLQYDVAQEHVQAHTRPLGKSVGTDAQFHGQGNVADDAQWKKNVRRYVNKIAKHVDKKLYGRHAPLILAGVDFEQAIFREDSSYRFLIDQGISSKTGQFDTDPLLRSARDVVEPWFERTVEQRLGRYYNQIDTPLTSSSIEDILPAAHTGRVETLLVDIRREIVGTFDPASQDVHLHEHRLEGDEDLLNLAAVYALQNDAAVYGVPAERLAGAAPLAAVFRY